MCSYNYNYQETNIQFYDQDLNEDFSLRYPKLYTPGHYDLLFNKKVFALSAAEGIISSLVLFFIPYGAFFNAVRPDGHDLVSHNAFGCVVASILIVAVTLRVSSTDDSWVVIIILAVFIFRIGTIQVLCNAFFLEFSHPRTPSQCL